MSNFIKEIVTGPGRVLNKSFDSVGVGKGNFFRRLSASSQLAQSVHDEGEGLSFRRILNPSGRGNIFDPAGGTSGAFSSEDPNAATADTPGVPTIDQARLAAQESDRLRRRRGVLANIFGGGRGSQPTVNVKTLLGQ